MTLKEVQEKAYFIIRDFPKSKNKQSFLTLKNGRKLFFNRFIQKYGLNYNETQYNSKDIVRRLRLVEFFDYITKEFDIKNKMTGNNQNRYIIETEFHRMVIIEKKLVMRIN